MKISAVIPARNELKTILSVAQGATKFADEIIVVFAKDSTDETLKALDGFNVRAVIDRGFGKGDAIKCGVEIASGDIIVFLDADGSHLTEDIPKLAEPIKSGNADLVIASRILGGSEEFTGDLNKMLRVLFSNIITLLINLRFGSSITDSQNGFRAIRREVITKLDLKANGFDIETEILMKTLKRGYTVVEIPSKELRRKYGKSGINMLTMGWKYALRLVINLF